MHVFLRAKICYALVHEAKRSLDFKWHSTETKKQHSSRFCAVNRIPEGSARHAVCLAMGCTGGGLGITSHKTHTFQSSRSQTGRDKCKYFPLIYLCTSKAPRFLNAGGPRVLHQWWQTSGLNNRKLTSGFGGFGAVGVWLTMCILLCTWAFMSQKQYRVF